MIRGIISTLYIVMDFFFTKSAEILLEFFCRRETKNFDNTKITVYVIREGIIEILAR